MTKKRLSQEDYVLAYLRKYKTINRDKAWNLFRIRRLGAIIYSLRIRGEREGFEIINRIPLQVGCKGRSSLIAVYHYQKLPALRM